MKSFQHLAEKNQYRDVSVNTSLVGKHTVCDLQDLENTLKRFHPLGQTGASMASVIQGSR